MSCAAVLLPVKGDASAVSIKAPRALKNQTTLTLPGVGTFVYACTNAVARVSFYELEGAVTRPSDLLSKCVSLPPLLTTYLFGGAVLVVANGGPLGAVASLPLPAWKTIFQATAATSAAALKKMHFVNGGRAQPKFSLQLNPLTRAVVVTKGALKDTTKEGRKKAGRCKKAQSKKSRANADEDLEEEDVEADDDDEEDEDEDVQEDEDVREEEVEEADDDCDNDDEADEDEDDELEDNFDEDEKDNNIDAEDEFPEGAAETDTARQTKFAK